MVVNEFVQLCQRYRVPAPEFEYSKDCLLYTSDAADE